MSNMGFPVDVKFWAEVAYGIRPAAVWIAYGVDAAAAYMDCKYGFVVVLAAAVGAILYVSKFLHF